MFRFTQAKIDDLINSITLPDKSEPEVFAELESLLDELRMESEIYDLRIKLLVASISFHALEANTADDMIDYFNFVEDCYIRVVNLRYYFIRNFEFMKNKEKKFMRIFLVKQWEKLSLALDG